MKPAMDISDAAPPELAPLFQPLTLGTVTLREPDRHGGSAAPGWRRTTFRLSGTSPTTASERSAGLD